MGPASIVYFYIYFSKVEFIVDFLIFKNTYIVSTQLYR